MAVQSDQRRQTLSVLSLANVLSERMLLQRILVRVCIARHIILLLNTLTTGDKIQPNIP